MVLIVSFNSKISPRTSTVIFFDRLPFATAVVTSAILRTCPVRLPAIMFTLSVRSFHVPATPRTSACPPSFPSLPTSRAFGSKGTKLIDHRVDRVFELQNFTAHIDGDLFRQVAIRKGGRDFGNVT